MKKKPRVQKKKDDKKEYIEKFIERNPETGPLYINELNTPSRILSLKEFTTRFPSEDQEEFWEKVIGMTVSKWNLSPSVVLLGDLNTPDATKHQPTNNPETQLSPVKSTSIIPLGSIPTEREVLYNKSVYNFPVNENGQFIKDGNIVDMFGNQIKGGNRKSKRRGGRRRVSNRRSKRRGYINGFN